jgi:predicted kinase
MKTLTILIGPPGSGKSTYAKNLEDTGFVRISQDDQGKNHLNIFKESISKGLDIVVDRMNFDKHQRDRYRVPGVEAGYTVNFIEFCVPKNICIVRCLKREDHPTIKTIENANSALYTYFSRYEEVSLEEGIVTYNKYSASERYPAIMCDLDGTLCNLDHRLHFVKGPGKKDWGSFFRECGNDSVYEDVAGFLRAEEGIGTPIILCSGRPEDQARKATLEWLKRHEIEYDDLVMRPRGNYKSDDITKAMLYRYEIEPYYIIKYVLDDRQQVVDKWREMGLTCFQVRPGDF